MESRDQRTFEFAAAEAQARDRFIQLGRALRDLDANADLCLLARLIYDHTSFGVGDPWRPEGGEETLLGHAWGCRCKRSSFYTVKKSRAYKTLITTADGGYQINWRGVYAARGLPLPQSLAKFTGANESAVAGVRVARATSGPLFECEDRTGAAAEFLESESNSWTGESKSWTGKSRNWTETSNNWTPHPGDLHTHCAPDAGARARLSSCLVVLSNVVVDDDKRQKIVCKAWEVRNAIFAHRLGAKLDTETRRFLATTAAIAVTLGDEWAEWIDYAVTVTAAGKADKPGAYLRNTLRNSLVEFAGICESTAEAAWMMGKLWAAARPIAKPILAKRDEAAEEEARAGK